MKAAIQLANPYIEYSDLGKVNARKILNRAPLRGHFNFSPSASEFILVRKCYLYTITQVKLPHM